MDIEAKARELACALGGKPSAPADARILSALREVERETEKRVAERCAEIAMGSTGPGNTPDQSQGYSDACREIAKAIRAEFGAKP